MSLESTKKHLDQLLADTDNKVIALTGRWGTGKSHLWKEVREKSQDDLIKAAFYISLFGLGDMAQVKLKLIQSPFVNAETRSKVRRTFTEAIDKVRERLPEFNKTFAALTDLALLSAPALLRGKIVVLDDIERKHQQLSIDEILGFIDEYSQQHETRFVLILNSDKLSNKVVWDTLREKVIDQEIRLDTSSAEAFAISIRLKPSPHAERIKTAVEICRLTNIRIICKVIKTVNQILRGHQNLSAAVLSRVIPSTVLLSAINYKGIEDGPTFEFVLSVGGADWLALSISKEEGKGESGDEKRRAGWLLLLEELGIRGCDDYEMLVVDYLQSGQLDSSAVSVIIDKYASEEDRTSAGEEARNFFQRLIWDHIATEAQLLSDARQLVTKAHLLDPYNATALGKVISKLPDGAAVGEELILQWVAAFKERDVKEVGDDDVFHRPIHPLIKAALDEIRDDAQRNTTVFDACMHIASHSGWGARQEVAINSASAKDYEATIKQLPISDLRSFMRKMLELKVNEHNYKLHFGVGIERFIDACRNIMQDPDSGRLGKLIERLFEDAKIDPLSEATPPKNDHGPAQASTAAATDVQ